MPNNLVVQLLLKTGAFSDDLKTARGQIQNFQKGCSTAGKAVSGFSQSLGINIGGIAKFGGVVGIAVAAGKEFKNILESSQTTADSFEATIAGCKGVIDSFRTSIATMDFSSFKNGLWDIYESAKAAQNAIDQLGNTQIAYDYKSKQNQTKFQEAYNMFKDPESTQQMKEDAKKQMKEAVDAQFTYASNYSSTLYKTYVAKVVKKAGAFNLPATNVTLSQFEKAMNIDIGLEGNIEKAREKNDIEYQKYLDAIAEYETSLWEQLNGGPKYNNLTAVENLKKQYKDVIAIHAMLQLMKDDELEGVAQLIGSMEDAKQLALSMEKTMNRAIKGEFSSGSKGSTGGKSSTTTTVGQEKKPEPLVNSLDYWKKILSEETKYRDALVKDTEEWKLHNDKVNEAAEKIKEIEEIEENRENIMKNSYTYYSNLVSDLKQQRDATNMDVDPQKWNELNSQLTEAEEKLSALDYISNNIDLNRYMSVEPPTISSLEKVVSILKEIRSNTPITYEYFEDLNDMIKFYEDQLNQAMGFEVEEPKTDTWDEFNKAMANTSTIANALFNTFKEGSEVTAASILQMISTTLPAIGSLISAISALTSAEAVEAGVAATGKAVSTSKHWIEAIAAVASLGAVVATAISAASKPNLQKFAEGGIVSGSSFTGDRVPAMVNSGEMILNKTQQARLFKIANGGAPGDNAVTFHISGTDLVGVLNNNSRKNKLIR